VSVAGGVPMADGSRVFTYDEALAMFPVVRELTSSALAQIDALVNPIQSAEEMADRREEIEATYRSIVTAWAEELTSLGCVVKGLWLVDWDSGAGYYCWKYPEATIAHFHGYEEGFAGRVPLN
jgi:hypothetical protein